MNQGGATRQVLVLRARWVLPMDRPAIEDGAVVVADEEVLAVGRWADLRRGLVGEVTDLGEVVVLPGLVNAHAHLDYTGMAGHLPRPKEFTDWIKGILALKAGWSYTEYAESWVSGANMLLRHGTTTVVDIEAVPELLPEVWSTTPLRVWSCLELTGVRSGRDPERLLSEALARVDRLPVGRSRAGLSPHAPYSTSSRMLELAAGARRERGVILTTHVAESRGEFDMFSGAKGPLYDWLRWNGRDMGDCGGGSPVAHLGRLGYLVPGLIAVHVNYLAEGDELWLARNRVGVVHCPRSHAYFGYDRFPLELLRAAGVELALGTDSLASVPCGPGRSVELDMFSEMRSLLKVRPGMRPGEVLRLATLGGAAVMGLAGRVGCLAEGSWADLVVVEMDRGLAGEGLAEGLVERRGPVQRVMIGGRWVYSVEEERLSQRAAAVGKPRGGGEAGAGI